MAGNLGALVALYVDILSAPIIFARTVPSRLPRGALRTVTSTSCPSNERKCTRGSMGNPASQLFEELL